MKFHFMTETKINALCIRLKQFLILIIAVSNSMHTDAQNLYSLGSTYPSADTRGVQKNLFFENPDKKESFKGQTPNVSFDLGTKTETKEITQNNWKNRNNSLYGDYPILISSRSNPKDNIFSAAQLLNDCAISQGAIGKTLYMNSIGKKNEKVYLKQFAEYKIGYGTTTKIWKPNKTNIIIGSVFALLGSAVILKQPFPDFTSEDAKVGPQILYIFAGSCAVVGLGFTIGGTAHTVTINQPKVDRNIVSDQLKLPITEENTRIKASLTQLFNQRHIKVKDKAIHVKGYPKQVIVSDDRIEFQINNTKSIFYYNNLYFNDLTSDNDLQKLLFIGDYEFKLDRNKNYRSLSDLSNMFTYIRNQIYKQAKGHVYSDQLEVFKPVATKYRALNVKPVVSEEQRKFIVQANTFLEEKNYDNAITSYYKAIDVDQTSYPRAYFNLALTYSMVNKYEDAIMNMNKYLLLVPNASDAREAQDKIYEWELKIK